MLDGFKQDVAGSPADALPITARKHESRLHEEWRLIVFVFIFGLGCASLIRYPSLIPSALIIGSFLLFIALLRYGLYSFQLAVCLAIILAASASSMRLANLAAYNFTPEQYVNIEGRIDQLDIRPEKSTRLVISVLKLERFRGDKSPRRLRLAVRTQLGPNVKVGSVVSLKAIISPLQGALVPGGFDFGRAARFQQIGGQGYAVSSIDLIKGGDASPQQSGFNVWVTSVRYGLAAKLQAAMPGQSGALAAALTLGLRHGISDQTSENLRRAGLSHLLAISGLHMGIVAAAAFFVFELLFALIPAIALRIMPRKLAVIPAWCLALTYLFLSGGSTSTIRAFLMVTVAMLAVLTNRRVLSLRSVALAALFILTLWPESIYTAGFQMSFAATTGLVAFYERFSARQTKKIGQVAAWQRVVRAVLLIGLTSLIAQISVAPFALYHFQAISVVGVGLNMLVLPIITFAVMPLLFVALILAALSSLDLISWMLEPLLTLVLNIAEAGASPAYATLRITPMSDLSFALLLIAGGLMLLFLNKKTMLASTALVLVAFNLPKPILPDILISRTGGVIAEYKNGMVFVSGGRANSFRVRSWQRYWGADPFADIGTIAKSGGYGASGIRMHNGGLLVRVTALSRVPQVCAEADIILLPRRYVRYCKGEGRIVTLENLDRQGPAGVIVTPEKPPRILWSNPEAE